MLVTEFTRQDTENLITELQLLELFCVALYPRYQFLLLRIGVVKDRVLDILCLLVLSIKLRQVR